VPFLFFVIMSWNSMSTENFTVIYPDESYRDCALQQLSILETYRERVIDFTHNDPGRTLLFIDDFGGTISGYSLPWVNSISLNRYIHPPIPRISSVTSWWRVGNVHEYTHIANMTSTGGIPKLFRGLFGKYFQPNLYVPTWVAESYTVYFESMQFPFEGRLNGGFYDAYGMCCAKDNKFPGMQDFTYYHYYKFPFYSLPYMWGGFMARHRAEKYGEEKVSDWADRYAKSIPLLTLESTHKSAYGKFSFDLYDELKREFEEDIIGYNFSQKSKVIYSGNEFLEFLTHDEHYLYFIRDKVMKTSPNKSISYSEILQLDPESGEFKVLLKDPILSEMPMRVKDGKIFYGKLDVFTSNENLIGYKFKNDIYSFDINTARKEKIYYDDGTLRVFDILKDGKLIVGRQKGWRGGIIEVIDEYKRDIIFSSDFDTPFDIAVGENKTAILMHNEDKGDRIFFLDGDAVRVEEPYSKCGLNFVGESLLFSSNRLGYWQAYMWKDSSLYKLTDLPFCTYPVVLDNKIYFIGMSSEGQTVEMVEMTGGEEIEVLEDLPDPFLPSYADLEYKKGGYINNFRHLLWDPVLRFPTISIEDDRTNIRLNVIGMDASGTRNLSWYVDFDEETNFTGYDIKYSTMSLRPSFLRTELQKDRDEHLAKVYLSYPAAISAGSGLQDVYLDFAAVYEDSLDYKRMPLVFSPVLVFGDYNKRFLLSPALIYDVYNGRESLQLFAESVFSYQGLSILFSGAGVCNVKSDSTILEPVCGEERRMRIGGGARFEIDYRLFNIERGNVGYNFMPIYLNDVWFRPFVEVMYSPAWEEPITTVGGLITLETSALYILNLEPSIGVGYRVDENKAYFLWGVSGTLGETSISIRARIHLDFPRAKNIFDFNISNFEFSIEKAFEMPWEL
jgi:hypothetical protein